MSDPKRKLPVIVYVTFWEGEPGSAYLDWKDAVGQGLIQGGTVATYETPVPMCKTCNRFSVLGQSARCQHEPNRHVPVDGSGYCHMHTELRRP